ncbi:hypothetical protein [Arthrobacter sp. 31Y]|uniref:hypothetical protein n=1 Tax=Arthrobacter sp. 31Y TaxID=1115632 RepID=UPI00163B4EAD|nr:hypothetical protein [Arthrobacter sp. 31Y]
MGNLSGTLTLMFSEEGRGFDMTLGELSKFVETAMARGADVESPIFPETERDEVVGFGVYINP